MPFQCLQSNEIWNFLKFSVGSVSQKILWHLKFLILLVCKTAQIFKGPTEGTCNVHGYEIRIQSMKAPKEQTNNSQLHIDSIGQFITTSAEVIWKSSLGRESLKKRP